ncbi:MAG: anthranilate synthase component I family protein [Cyanobacteria bacterium J06635_15]
MVMDLKAAIKYDEIFVSGQREPTVILQNLLQAGVFSKYVMYEQKNEVRIAGNELAKVSVSQDMVSIKGIDKFYSEPVSDPFKQVGELLGSLPIENWTAYGYVGFDIISFYSSYSKTIKQELLYFLIPETELCVTKEGVYVKSVRSLDQIRSLLLQDSQLLDYESSSVEANVADRKIYQDNIRALIEAIQKGELHKAIISRPLKLSGDLDLLGTYMVGAKVNNAARSYCLDFGNVRTVGFSPETLLEVYQDRSVVTNPLAGTRPRGKKQQEDECLTGELFTDAKEVKEHALSVWLAQDEIESICIPGTIRIFNFMEVKKYRTVQHLSSRVGGVLKPDNTPWDALKALFPGVTVSGIDKQQALEWIDHLETEPRGMYAGCIGWIDSNGTADLAISLRSVYQYDNDIYLNAGAGIVAESVPQKEYIESANKMNTMLTNLVLKS